MNIFKQILHVLILVLSFAPYATMASETTGYISTTTLHTALVCHNPACALSESGIINFLPENSVPITITDGGGVRGYAWGNELGWINFSPENGGVTISPDTGDLSGYAWSQVSGWINFRTSTHGVSINERGEFVGWAWTGGPRGGWIKFDCSVPSACVKTDWKHFRLRTTTAVAGIKTNATTTDIAIDACANLPGLQSVIPVGYYLNTDKYCALIAVDFCPNIANNQSSIPDGYVLSADGKCNLLTQNTIISTPTLVEVPLVTANQASAGKSGSMTLGGSGMAYVQSDSCSNVDGIQVVIPDGYQKDRQGKCISTTTDYCPNFAGAQFDIPIGFVIADNGQCVVEPEVLYSASSTTATNAITSKSDTQVERVIAYSFVPSTLRVPVRLPILSSLLQRDSDFSPPQLDAISFVGTGISIGLLITGLMLFL